MRKLGLNATSAGAIRFIKRHVIRLELDTSHFTGSAAGQTHSSGVQRLTLCRGTN
jgi:hypothetical protein